MEWTATENMEIALIRATIMQLYEFSSTLNVKEVKLSTKLLHSMINIKQAAYKKKKIQIS